MAVNVIRKPIRIVQATSIVMVATLASAALGVLRESLTAAHFGVGLETDAYFFSFGLIVRLPQFLLAATASALIPIYIRSKKEGRSGHFINTVISVYGLFLLALTIVGLIAIEPIVSVLASGFDAEGQQLVTQMILILAPTIIIASMWGILKSLLNAEGNFFLSTISNAFLSVGVVSAILLLSPQLGVYSLPIGILIASALQVLWTGYWSWQSGFRFRFSLNLKEPEFRRFMVLLGPGIFGSLLSYVISIIDRSMASHLPEGTVAAIGFAARPMTILTNIAIFSFITAFLPSFSQKALELDRKGFRQSVAKTLGLLIFITTPLSLLLVALRSPLMQLLFERGRFDAVATANTSNLFAGYVIGLMPMAIAITVSTVFKAIEDTKTPAIFGAGSNLVSKIILNVLFVAAFGAIGFALATSVMYIVSGLILLFILRRRLQGIQSRYLLKTLLSVLLAATLAMSPVYLLVTYANMSPFAMAALGSSLGLALFLMFSALLRIPELQTLVEHLLKLINNRVLKDLPRSK